MLLIYYISLYLVISFNLTNLNQFNLLFPVVSGNSYSIEGSGDLRDWQVLESDIEGDGEAIERNYSASEVFRFYRVRRQ